MVSVTTNHFRELLAVLKPEELIRVRHRFKKLEHAEMYGLLDAEIRAREISEREQTRQWLESLTQECRGEGPHTKGPIDESA